MGAPAQGRPAACFDELRRAAGFARWARGGTDALNR